MQYRNYHSTYSQSAQNQSGTYPMFVDPGLIQTARDLYRDYREAHAQRSQRPIGVAIDPKTYRGHLVFGAKPILLPMESFLPIEYLDGEAA